MKSQNFIVCIIAAVVAVPFTVMANSRPVPKFGYCPSNPSWNAAVCLFDKHAPQCKDDSSCPGVQKCCATQSCYARCEDPTCAPPPMVKPGKCRKPTEAGICWEGCRGDDSCPGAQKCCSNGCGHTCQVPETSVVHPGFCPNIKPNTVGVCSIACASDSDCERNYKCCSTACGGRTCLPGVVDQIPG